MKRKMVYRYTLKREKVMEIRDAPAAKSPECVVDFLKGLGLQEREQEEFLSIVLDTRGKIKGYTTVSIGLIDKTYVHAREVFRHAIIAGASRVILAHNHPSGDPTPTGQDIIATKELTAAGKIVGIEVLDHVVIGEDGYISFREENLL